MRRIHTFALLIVLFISSFQFAPAVDPSKTTPNRNTGILSVKELKQRAESFDTTLNFTDLRLSFARDENNININSEELDVLRKKMFNSFSAGNYNEAAALSDSILTMNYCDLFARMGCINVYEKLGDSARIKLNKFIFNGLLKSIFNSGNGKSPEKAWLVTGIAEENFILTYLGYKLVKRDFQNTEYGPVDIVTVANKSGKQADMYFNVSVLYD